MHCIDFDLNSKPNQIRSPTYVSVIDMKRLQRMRLKNVPFVVRTTGGAASQCLGLMIAIFVSKNIGRPFQIRHYPVNTGGYYPLGIASLLSKDELYTEDEQNSLNVDYSSLTVGELLEPVDLKSRHSRYDRVVIALTRIGLDKYVNQFRMIWHIDGSFRRLKRIPYYVRVVNPGSSGYFPFSDQGVLEDLKLRFERAELPSPFKSLKDPDVVIHVRLGDKRRAFARPDLGGAVNGIVDPISFVEILRQEGFLWSENIYVVSDDPVEAKRLLAESGIKAQINEIQGDLWEDLSLMSRSKVVLCPWSTVSQFSAVCLSGTDIRFYYPKTAGDGIPARWQWNQSNVNFYDATYLPKEHRLYVTPYESIAASHKIYGEKKK